MSRYSYSSLRPGEIRLLKLLPATNEYDPIKCELINVSLHSAPAYEAVSYEWQAVPGTTWIQVHTGILKIGKTLGLALQGMRGKDKARMLWADGICVNQGCKDEIQKQLVQMDGVYERSIATLVWLGSSTPKSTAAVEVLHSLALLARQHNAFAGMERNNFAPFVFEKQPSGASVFIRDENMLMTERDSDRTWSTVCLSRKSGKSDENIFQFKDFELWCEIDGMFSNSYFQRTWIEREVAKAPHVKLCHGPHIISWPLFTSAFIGRNLLLFHPQHPGPRFTGSLQTVVDARQRWRTPEHGTTLAGALVALTYSKETRKHDHIYAAYAMSKYAIEWLETPGHDIDIEELMLRTSCACIQETDDLYHLGQWCVTSRKVMNLPTWAPDFTSGVCELAVEFASESTSRLIKGAYNICGELLCLDAHLVDSIEWCHDVGDCGDIENIIKCIQELESISREHGEFGLFQEYVASRKGWLPSKTPQIWKEELLQQLSQAEIILSQWSWYPKSCLSQLGLLRHSIQQQPAPSTGCYQLTIEALWTLLNPSSQIRRPRPCLGEHLFLAWLYLISMRSSQHSMMNKADLPKAYASLASALEPLFTFDRQSSSASDVVNSTVRFAREHLSHSKISRYESECIFVTKGGFLGRTVSGEACKDDVVAFLGGGWTPYVLKRRGQSYCVKGFAYIEGLATIRTRPASWKVERICLR